MDSLGFFRDGMGLIEVYFIEYKESMKQHDIYGIFNENIPECVLSFKQIDFIKHKEPTSNMSGTYNEYDIFFSVNEKKYNTYVVTPAVVKINLNYDDWYIGDEPVNKAFKKMLDEIGNYAKVTFLPGEKEKACKAFKKR